MRVSGKFKGKLSNAKIHLTILDDQPLNKAALVIVLFLDIFILMTIFNGLDAHTRQFAFPDEYIPYSCREIVIDLQWNPTNRIDNLSQIIISTSSSFYRVEVKKKDQHPVCAPYIDLIEQVRNDKTLTGIFEDRTNLILKQRNFSPGSTV
jgi:hypothetical protein